MSNTPTLPACTADTTDPDRCRYKTRAASLGIGALHTCANRDGAPLQPGQVCAAEARTQTLEQGGDWHRYPADMLAARAAAEAGRGAKAVPARWPAEYWRGEHREDATCVNCRQPITRYASGGQTWGSNGQIRGDQQWGTWEHTTTGRAECGTPDKAA